MHELVVSEARVERGVRYPQRALLQDCESPQGDVPVHLPIEEPLHDGYRCGGAVKRGAKKEGGDISKHLNTQTSNTQTSNTQTSKYTNI